MGTARSATTRGRRGLLALAVCVLAIGSALDPVQAGPLEVERALVAGRQPEDRSDDALAFVEWKQRVVGASPRDPGEPATRLARSSDPGWRSIGLEGLAVLDRGAEGLAPEAATLLRALAAAHAGRCGEFPQLQGAVSVSSPPEALVLADAERRCGMHEAALGRLAALLPSRRPDDPANDPRAAVLFGMIQAQLGDDDAASMWCGAAARSARGVASIEHRAARCAAAADARRGKLPSGREAYFAACEATTAQRWLPPTERQAAAIAGAFALLALDFPEHASRAEALLQLAAALPGADASAPQRAALQALALLTRGRADAAAGAAARAGLGRRTDPLAAYVRARLIESQAGASAAELALETVARDALTGGEYGVAIAAADYAARIDLAMSNPDHARGLLTAVLAETTLQRLLSASTPLIDPAATRRAFDRLAQTHLGEAGVPSERGVIALLEQVEWLRQRAAGRAEAFRDAVTVDTARRYLATEDAVVLIYLVGEERSYLWRLDSVSVTLRRLPSGDVLFDALGPLAEGLERTLDPARAALVHGGLAHTINSGTAMLILPDGFLYNVPWGALPAPPDRPEARWLSDTIDVAVVPSLRALCAPIGLLARDPDAPLELLGLVAPGDGALPDPDSGALGRYDRFERLSPSAASTLPRENDPAVLHLALPLLAADVNGLPLAGAEPTRAGGALRPLSLASTYTERIPELVTIAPTAGPRAPAATRVRAGARAVERGSRAAIVALHDLPVAEAAAVWERVYGELSRGQRDTAVIARLSRADPAHQPIAAHGLIVVGRGASRLVEPRPQGWAFWLLTTVGAAITGFAIWRARRRRFPRSAHLPDDEFAIE